MKSFDVWAQELLEKDIFPDFLIRWAIRQRLAKLLEVEGRGGSAEVQKRKTKLIEDLKKSPIAVHMKEANQQHYEVPTQFYQLVLGNRLKYSSGYWPAGVNDLNASEEAMLALVAERAELAQGQNVLELGCGWGSMTLYMAEKFPQSKITGVSNSKTQKQFIDEEAKRRGLNNVRIVTADMNDFDIAETFDRVVSIEMFEHMRNYEKLTEKISRWLAQQGKLFVHIFAHKEYAYLFTTEDESDWMARYFFTGGTMPSHDLLLQFNRYLKAEKQWIVPGIHYEKTSNAWLSEMDKKKDSVTPILEQTYGAEVKKWRVYWRVFFIACAELFGYRNGSEWIVSHYLFVKA